MNFSRLAELTLVVERSEVCGVDKKSTHGRSCNERSFRRNASQQEASLLPKAERTV